MKELLKQEEIKTTKTIVNEEALKEIAIELLKGNFKELGFTVDRSWNERTTEIEIMVDGYKIAIENTRLY